MRSCLFEVCIVLFHKIWMCCSMEKYLLLLLLTDSSTSLHILYLFLCLEFFLFFLFFVLILHPFLYKNHEVQIIRIILILFFYEAQSESYKKCVCTEVKRVILFLCNRFFIRTKKAFFHYLVLFLQKILKLICSYCSVLNNC